MACPASSRAGRNPVFSEEFKMTIYFKTGNNEGDLAFFHSQEVSSEKTTEAVGYGVLVQKFRNQPAQMDGVSVLMKVDEKEPAKVSGFMEFPERAHFEFDGSFPEMLAAIKTLRGPREIFGFQKFTFWRA